MSLSQPCALRASIANVRYSRMRIRPVHVYATLCFLVAAVCVAAERQWQTGTCVDLGIKRTPWVGDPSTPDHSEPLLIVSDLSVGQRLNSASFRTSASLCE